MVRSVHPISNLKLMKQQNAWRSLPNDWTIKAKITSKTNMTTKHGKDGSSKFFSIHVKDDSGEIRVLVNNQCDTFYEKAVVGKIFFISNCSVSRLYKDNVLETKDTGTLEEADDVPPVKADIAKDELILKLQTKLRDPRKRKVKTLTILML